MSVFLICADVVEILQLYVENGMQYAINAITSAEWWQIINFASNLLSFLLS